VSVESSGIRARESVQKSRQGEQERGRQTEKQTREREDEIGPFLRYQGLGIEFLLAYYKDQDSCTHQRERETKSERKKSALREIIKNE